MQRLLELIPPEVTHIDLLAPPFSGHLHPILAQARALAPYYKVRVITTRGALPAVKAAGIDGVALPGDYDTPLQNVVNPRYAIKANPVRLYRQFRAVVTLLAQFARELEQVWQHQGVPDLVIADFTLPVVGQACQRFAIPWWTSLPSPCVLETPDGAPAYCGGLMPAKTVWQRGIHTLHRHKVSLFKRAMFWLFRRTIRMTGITRLYREDGSESAYSPTRILALSEADFEFPRSWPETVRFIGPALYTPPVSTLPPPFIEGRKHVLVTLGTHLDWHKDEVVRALKVLASSLPEWVFHFTEGHAAGDNGPSQGNLYRLAWVDYDRYLSRYDAVIHHGGAGIMWHCLQQGIPALVYPVDYDQFDHAARLEFRGKGVWIKGGVCGLESAGGQLQRLTKKMVAGEGFEPSKSMTTDLQSAPFGRSGTPPGV